jgi:hypothetical protein
MDDKYDAIIVKMIALLDMLGLTSVHSALTEILVAYGVGRESSAYACGVIYLLGTLCVIGYLGNPTPPQTNSQTNNSNKDNQ